jgi:multisubunit Na+/H+ antiporter MnhC subunit
LQLFNLIYIALSCPFYIAFNIQATGIVLAVEILSHAISLAVLLLNFRTPVVEELGEKSLNIWKITKRYFRNGLVIDFFGMLPLNIVLSLTFKLVSPNVKVQNVMIVAVARTIRMVSIWPALSIFQLLKIHFKKYAFSISLMGNGAFLFFVTHWTVCAWYFLISEVE